jgi:hypothetical protein
MAKNREGGEMGYAYTREDVRGEASCGSQPRSHVSVDAVSALLVRKYSYHLLFPFEFICLYCPCNPGAM